MRQMNSIYKKLDSNRSMLYVWFSLMHTRIDILLCNRKEKDLFQIAEMLYSRIFKLEKTANYFDTSSELYRLNQTASHMAVAVSDDLYNLINQSKAYNIMTTGYFDITFASDGHTTSTINDVFLSERDKHISFQKEGTRVNLSGYLKGYAIESIREILYHHGVQDALINMGNSSVLGLGNMPCGEGWDVAFDSTIQSVKNIKLNNECLTTSGNGTIEHKHIISPYTHQCMEGVRIVSVRTKKATEGEALSTGLFAAPESHRAIILGNFDATLVE